jgi:uncharacterized protein YqeY
VALKEQINIDLKAALLGGDRFKGEVLRGFKAVILNEEVSQNKRDTGLDETTIEQLVAREIKKRHESATIYISAGRPELADSERAEIAVLNNYLPAQVSEQEINDAITRIIAEKNVTNASGMGQVIGAVKQQFGTSADGALIAHLVKNALQ